MSHSARPMRLLQRLLELGRRLEAHRLRGRDLDLGAGLGVAAHAARPAASRRRSRSPASRSACPCGCPSRGSRRRRRPPSATCRFDRRGGRAWTFSIRSALVMAVASPRERANLAVPLGDRQAAGMARRRNRALRPESADPEERPRLVRRRRLAPGARGELHRRATRARPSPAPGRPSRRTGCPPARRGRGRRARSASSAMGSWKRPTPATDQWRRLGQPLEQERQVPLARGHAARHAEHELHVVGLRRGGPSRGASAACRACPAS